MLSSVYVNPKLQLLSVCEHILFGSNGGFSRLSLTAFDLNKLSCFVFIIKGRKIGSLIECLFGQRVWTALPPALCVASSQQKSISGSSSRAEGGTQPYVKHWFRSRPQAERLGARTLPLRRKPGPRKLDSPVSKNPGWKHKRWMFPRHETNVWPNTKIHECRVRGTSQDPRSLRGTWCNSM